MLQFENSSQIEVFMQRKEYQTAGRRALLQYVKEYTTATPRGADEIYEGMRERGEAPGRSSVYRMLGGLCELGTVRKFRADAGSERYVYQYVGEGEHCEGHLHLQCLSCGKIAHLKCHCNDEISAHLMASHGFAVDSGHSVLYGTCATCQKKAGEAHG